MNSNLRWMIVGASSCIAALLLMGARTGRGASSDDVYEHLRVYTDVLERIKLEYVEEPDMKNVTLGAINGLLESVDPFASYLNADQFRQYEKGADTQKSAGLGLILAKRYGYVAVVDALPGSPADKANISTGDLIESINNVATRDMPLAYAEQLLRGDVGSNVSITVLRLKAPDPEKLSLARVNVPIPAIASKMLPNEVGYLHITSLSGDRVTEAKTKVGDLKKQGAKYIVLDLRHCSTGEIESGVPLANLFLDKGAIVSLKGQKMDKQNFEAKAESSVWQGPLVVITNRATAGGAEIAAAALLDDKRAQVVGERSYGDASLRKTIQMDDGGAVILSVAKYYSPSGKAIQDGGVTPSVQLAENESTPDVDQDGNPVPGSAPKSPEDNLLKQSVDLVTGKTTIAQLSNQDETPLARGDKAPATRESHPIEQKAPNQK